MNESVLSGIIFAAQFSVASMVASIGILVLAVTVIALNRLFHMYWIPTNFASKISNFLNDKGSAVKRQDPVLPGGGAGEQFDPAKHTTYKVTVGEDGMIKGPTIYNSGSGGIYNNPPDVTGMGGGTKPKDKK